MKHTFLPSVFLSLAVLAATASLVGTARAQDCTAQSDCESGESCVEGTCQMTSSSPSGLKGGPLIVPAYQPLTLIQPLDDSTYILQPRSGIDIAFDYFNLSFPWLVGVAAGLAVLQGIVAGLQIMYGGGPEQVAEGKTRFLWALGGMLLLGLAGVILRALNPIFFR
jgi:hypothetical protein